jgi:hypothetical protein
MASFTMMEHLVAQEAVVYPAVTRLAEKARQEVEKVFAEAGIAARCTGRQSNAMPASSMAAVQFPYDPVEDIAILQEACAKAAKRIQSAA